MANIPVEKNESGAAWLPWLLGALALAAVAFFVFQAMDDPDTVETAETVAPVTESLEDMTPEAPEGVVTAGIDTVRSVGALDEAIAAARDGMASGETMDLDGIAVVLDDVRVTSLAGDSTFFIGDGDDRTLVMLSTLGESENGPGDGSDGRYDVNDGATVSIDGMLKRFSRDMPGTTGLSEEDVAGVEIRQYVIVVRDPSQFSIAR